ncbi:hypothetical protein C8R43DRAFT_875880, partial [Mycena crocata]
PPPRTHPSKYWQCQCPLCFGGLKHDLADLLVCINACSMQKGNKASQDPPKTHPNTHFVLEGVVVQTKAYVNGVHNGSGTWKHRKATVQDVEEDSHNDPALPLPCLVLDRYEVSFKAADKKHEKASTHYFQDTVVMALFCWHDHILWLVNMHSIGKKTI